MTAFPAACSDEDRGTGTLIDGREVGVDTYSVVLTIVVLLAVALLILLFERKRARQIERDLQEMARQRRRKDAP